MNKKYTVVGFNFTCFIVMCLPRTIIFVSNVCDANIPPSTMRKHLSNKATRSQKELLDAFMCMMNRCIKRIMQVFCHTSGDIHYSDTLFWIEFLTWLNRDKVSAVHVGSTCTSLSKWWFCDWYHIWHSNEEWHDCHIKFSFHLGIQLLRAWCAVLNVMRIHAFKFNCLKVLSYI